MTSLSVVMSVYNEAPAYAFAHGLGMWRGLGLAARQRIARASRP